MSVAPAPRVPPVMVEQYARELVRRDPDARVLALRAQPVYDGPAELGVESKRVLVRACVSALAVREALTQPAEGEYLLLLTDRPDEDLGESITARFWHQRVQPVDPWRTIPGLFGADRVVGDLRRPQWAWVAEALMSLAPPSGGYPAAPSGVVDVDHAVMALAESLIGLPHDQWGVGPLMEWSLDPTARTGWQVQEPDVRAGISEWMARSVSAESALVLTVGAAPGGVDAFTVGLAVDALWSGAPGPEAAAARVRIEPFVGGSPLAESVARAFARGARSTAWRMADADPQARAAACERAQRLLADVGWPAGAQLSLVLPDGFDARLRALAHAIAQAVADPGALPAAEAALLEVERHDSAATDRSADTETARMAMRLARWLAAGDDPRPTRLAEALTRQVAVDGWVDWALGVVWAGSGDPNLAAALAGLCSAVQQRRRGHDEQTAALLAEATARTSLPDGVVGVESALTNLVAPVAEAAPVLLVVVDGMSAGVACELVADATRIGWAEAVPADTATRTAVLAALPTLTRYSRTSLLTGQLADGTQVDEKRAFPELLGGPIFHKDDLRSPAGATLPTPVLDAVASPARVVGVVLNTVDDALAKADPDATAWTVPTIGHLAVLLRVAGQAGRVVVLTSDHGHVVERGGTAGPMPGAETRWRPAGDAPPGPHEVRLSGPRVLAPGGTIIAPWVEDHRYGAKAAGYHGGASAAELTIPFVVLARDPAILTPAGYVQAPPLAPEWWDRGLSGRPQDVSVAGGAGASDAAAARPAGRRPAPAAQGQGELFATSGTAVGPGPATGRSGAEPVGLAGQLLASPVYARQKERARRAALPDPVVAAAVGVLLAGDGRAGRATIAAAAGFAANRFDQNFAALARLLNVDRYPVIQLDADGRTVLLDAELMRRQFHLAGAP